MSVTIHDIAALAGLNSSTVSRALRGDPRVREETRLRILTLAKQNGYTINRNARALAAGKTFMLALVYGQNTREMEMVPIGQVAAAVNDILEPLGYSLMILPFSSRPGQFQKCLLQLSRGICDGAVLVSPPCGKEDSPEANLLQNLPIPVIALDQWPEHTDMPYVTTDAEQSIRQLVSRVLTYHPEVAFIGFEETNNVARQRKNYTEKILHEEQIPFSSNLQELALLLEQKKIRNLAVFADSPRSVPDLAELMEKNGKVQCIGGMFDEWTFHTASCYKRIFLCIQDFTGMGTAAARYLIEAIDGKGSMQKQILIPCFRIMEPEIR